MNAKLKAVVIDSEIHPYGVKGYFEKDFVDSIKGMTPGEWVLFQSKSKKGSAIGFINPNVTRGHVAWSLGINEINFSSVEDVIIEKINNGFKYRKDIGINDGRLFYGLEDGLPGLIIDKYSNCLIIQITTAGVDKYRELISSYCSKYFSISTYLLDEDKYREAEGLPKYENQPLPQFILAKENELKFEIPSNMLQKIGFYFDQGENRLRLMTKIKQINIEIKSCLDLFSYVGAWGLTAAFIGAKSVDFVDQADLKSVIQRNIETNHLNFIFNFYRHDIFKGLPAEIKEKKYDLVVFDPPALSKKKSDLKNALVGYEKGVRSTLCKVNSGGLFVFSSCTYGITFDDMCRVMNSCAKFLNKDIRVLDLGMQRSDHPFSSLLSQSFYLKYILYYVK